MFLLLKYKKEKKSSVICIKKIKSYVVTHGGILSSWVVETGGPAVQRLEASLSYMRPHLKRIGGGEKKKKTDSLI